MTKLTPKQAAILAFIQDEISRRGRPPTVREIAARFRFASTHAVRCHLAALERKGAIERTKHAARGLRVVGGREGLPIVGRVAAGTPIAAEENLEGHLSPDDLAPQGKGVFCLRVQGDSMVAAGILDGDYVAVQPKATFDDGEIGVLVIDEEATVKRLRHKGKLVELIPENPSMAPFGVDPSLAECRYAGEVVAVFRSLRQSASRAGV